jgi:hypothetical protein
MLDRSGVMGLFVSTLAVSAWAEKTCWIVRGPEGNCTIVETEPEPTQTAIEKLGRGGYPSREEAEADLDRVCNQ